MSSQNGSQAFCLKLNSHQCQLIESFQKLYSDQTMVDCTLSCSGGNLKAHKIVLSACSPYFAQLFSGFTNPYQYPVIILKDMPFADLKAIVEFMYRGEVTIPQSTLPSVLDAAKNLMITGLCDIKIANSDSIRETKTPEPSKPTGGRRGRKRRRRGAADKSSGGDGESGLAEESESGSESESPEKVTKEEAQGGSIEEGDGEQASVEQLASNEAATEVVDIPIIATPPTSTPASGPRSSARLTPSAAMKASLRAQRIEKLQAQTGGLSGRKMWSEEETRTLVKVWEEESARVWASAGKKVLSLKRISDLLAADNIDRDVSQVEGKIKALKRDYKAVKADRAIPAVQARMAPYLDKLDAVFSREEL